MNLSILCYINLQKCSHCVHFSHRCKCFFIIFSLSLMIPTTNKSIFVSLDGLICIVFDGKDLFATNRLLSFEQISQIPCPTQLKCIYFNLRCLSSSFIFKSFFILSWHQTRTHSRKKRVMVIRKLSITHIISYGIQGFTWTRWRRLCL